MARKYRVAVHGAGWVSGEHIKAFQSNPHAEVVAVSSRKESSARAKALETGLKDAEIYTNYEKLVANKDIDIVSICTPNDLHARETILAAEAGKHIVIEKPVALNLEDLKKMRDAVRKAKVKTVVSFVLRWNPLFETIKALLADNAVGDVFYVETDYQHNVGPWYAGYEWVTKFAHAGGTFLAAGCHAMDALRWFAAKGQYETMDIAEVTAYEGGYRQKVDLDYPGFSLAIVKFKNGALGKVTSNFDCIMPYNFPIEIHGDKGTIKDNRVYSHKFPGQKGWVTIPTILPDSGDVTHHPFKGQINHFIECIMQDKESHCNLEDVVNTHEACIATMISAREKRTVKLPLIED